MLVLIKKAGVPHLSWQLEHILSTHPGRDGISLGAVDETRFSKVGVRSLYIGARCLQQRRKQLVEKSDSREQGIVLKNTWS